MRIGARETASRTNDFWLQSTALYDQRGWPLTDLLAADGSANAVTPEDVNAEARKYLAIGHRCDALLRATFLNEAANVRIRTAGDGSAPRVTR